MSMPLKPFFAKQKFNTCSLLRNFALKEQINTCPVYALNWFVDKRRTDFDSFNVITLWRFYLSYDRV